MPRMSMQIHDMHVFVGLQSRISRRLTVNKLANQSPGLPSVRRFQTQGQTVLTPCLAVLETNMTQGTGSFTNCPERVCESPPGEGYHPLPQERVIGLGNSSLFPITLP